MTILSIVFAAQMIVLLLLLMRLDYTTTRELITPWTIFLGMSIIDVFAPALLFLGAGMPWQPDWRAPLDDKDLLAALGVFTTSIGCFAVGYFFVATNGWRTRLRTAPRGGSATVLHVRWAYLALVVSGGWYLLTLSVDITEAGSLDAYFTNKLLRRWIPEALEFTTIWEFAFQRVGTPMLTVFLTIIGMLFFARHQYRHRVLWGMVLPFVGWLFTLTTFFRGFQLAYFVSLVAVETLRMKSVPLESVRLPRVRRVRTMLGLLGLGMLLFVVYGTTRNYYSSQARDDMNILTGSSTGSSTGIPTGESALVEEMERFIRGEGLIGLASIMAFYPQKGDYFAGKTLLDMTLLPIPRFIWTTKPEWYGIDDITRRMGWPVTTQSAVTMPGELYANFGPFGIPLMGVFGALFGWFYKHRYAFTLRFVYAFVLLPCMLVAFWMSYTGLMNSLQNVPVIAGTIVVLYRRKERRRGRGLR